MLLKIRSLHRLGGLQAKLGQHQLHMMLGLIHNGQVWNSQFCKKVTEIQLL